MNGKFFDLKTEKQDRIINAALKLFALNGYKKASTDDIVREAGISKGLLFHYFISKQGVYIFVYEYSARYMAMELSRTVALKENDFFALQKQMEQAKIQVMRKYPYMQQFLNNAFLEEDNITGEVASIMDKVSGNLQKIYEKADLERFKDGIDTSKVFKMVLFTLEGLANEVLRKDADKINYEQLYRDIVGYLNMLKENMYKPEYV